MKPTLRCYEIPHAFSELMQRIVSDEGVISESGLAELNDLIAKAQESAASLGCYIRQLELESEAVSTVAKTAAQRADRLSSQAKRWREYLLNTLDAAGINKINDPRISIRVQNNPPSVAIYEERDIPPTY